MRNKITASSLFAAGLLFAAASCTDKKGTTTTSSLQPPASNAQASSASSRIAWFDIDSFQAHYTLLVNKNKEFTAQGESMQNELERSAQQLQASAADFQKKVQEGKMTQTEGEATQRKLQQMQQSLETRRQSMEADFAKKRDAFNDTYRAKMDSFLQKLSAERHFDYVFAFSKSNPSLMYANRGLNITQAVIDGMNDEAKK